MKSISSALLISIYNNIYKSTAEDQFFKTKTTKKLTLDKNNHTVETYTKTNKNALETKEQNIDNNLTKKKEQH